MESSFESGSNIQEIAEAYALDAIDFAREHFSVALDGTDSSLSHVESILERFHAELSNSRPTPEQILQFAKMFGSCRRRA